MDNVTINVALVFSIISVIGVISTIWNNHKKQRDDTERKNIEIEKNFITLNIKLDQLTNTINGLAENDRTRASELQAINKSMAHYEEQLKTLFNKVEKIENGMIGHG